MAKRTLPLRAGRRVRWTIEVLPEAGAKKRARAKKTASKPRRAKSSVTKARVAVASPLEPAQSASTASVPKPLAPAQPATWLRAIVPIAAVTLVVAAVAFPRRSPAPVADGTAAPPEARDVAAAVAPSVPRIAPPPVPSAAPAAASIVVTPRPVNEPRETPAPKPVMNRVTPGTSHAPVGTASAVAEPPSHEESAAHPAVPEAPTSAATPSTASPLPAPVTVTGCLEVSTDGDTFRLNDIEGADAPKSRSWRTGFLKKRPAPVMLIEPPDRQALTTNVGRRVAATGQLTNRELKVNALRVVGSSCN